MKVEWGCGTWWKPVRSLSCPNTAEAVWGRERGPRPSLRYTWPACCPWRYTHTHTHRAGNFCAKLFCNISIWSKLFRFHSALWIWFLTVSYSTVYLADHFDVIDLHYAHSIILTLSPPLPCSPGDIAEVCGWPVHSDSQHQSSCPAGCQILLWPAGRPGGTAWHLRPRDDTHLEDQQVHLRLKLWTHSEEMRMKLSIISLM